MSPGGVQRPRGGGWTARRRTWTVRLAVRVEPGAAPTAARWRIRVGAPATRSRKVEAAGAIPAPSLRPAPRVMRRRPDPDPQPRAPRRAASGLVLRSVRGHGAAAPWGRCGLERHSPAHCGRGRQPSPRIDQQAWGDWVPGALGAARLGPTRAGSGRHGEGDSEGRGGSETCEWGW
jgi:hypothetical protein